MPRDTLSPSILGQIPSIPAALVMFGELRAMKTSSEEKVTSCRWIGIGCAEKAGVHFNLGVHTFKVITKETNLTHFIIGTD